MVNIRVILTQSNHTITDSEKILINEKLDKEFYFKLLGILRETLFLGFKQVAH
jgi:hypothetical protein